MQSFDVFIIGAGQAGPSLARALAQRGMSVAIAERKHMGGSCLNFGCTPTKAAVASARVAYLARRASDYGVNVSSVEVDFARVIQRARELAISFRDGMRNSFMPFDNPRLIEAHARLDGREGESFRIRVADDRYTAKHVVLDTGTRTLVPPIDGLSDLPFIHAGNWLEKTELPPRLVVLGGGYIGVEMAQFYRRMGSDVTILEGSAQIAAHEDEEVSSAIAKILTDEGIEIHTKVRVTRVSRAERGIRLTIEGGQAIDATDLFLAIGRKPNTDDLGLETVGVTMSDTGVVKADERLATNIDRIWVAGDIRGGPMFTHTAWDDYRIIESQIVGTDRKTTSGRVIPYGVFTDPELGRVGMTETEARQSGRTIRVLRYDMANNAKALELGEPRGFVKLVVDAGSEQLLGAAILSVEGAELVHVCIDLMKAGAPISNIRDAIYIHPTLAEALQSAALVSS
ncbi:MAG TPA: mercuric reductase [Thermoanaerobaculia bacterium]|nr:mercuric reductase [Thermoanaerobaculia bacterium]